MRIIMSKNYSTCFLAFCLCFFLISCHSNNTEQSPRNDIIGRQLVFHDSLKLLNLDEYRGNFGGIESSQKILVHIDSLMCGPCFVNRIAIWSKLIDLAEEYHQSTSLLMMVTPKAAESSAAEKFMLSNPLDYPLYLDKRGLFQTNNNIPRGLFVCLLDSSNRIILTGSPLSDEELWKQYQDSIINYHLKYYNNEED